MTDTTPWHEGERAVQRRLGFAEHAEARGGNIRDFMPDQHRAFFAQLPFAVLGTLDPVGNPWATILTGEPGFLSSSDPKTLHIDAYPQDGDPAASGILPGARIGLLGIELSTRRRNRMNGRVIDIDVSGFTVMVEQSFGNCPQYIQRRDYGRRRSPSFPEAEPIAFGDVDAASRLCGTGRRRRRDKRSVGGGDQAHRPRSPIAAVAPALSAPPKTARSKSRITAATAISTRWAICSPIRAPAC
jgi:predicted pyridoxine 5'-phosphate oxidase superfamily flavin-nucleotide-binding protein